eukprot:422079_1
MDSKQEETKEIIDQLHNDHLSIRNLYHRYTKPTEDTPNVATKISTECRFQLLLNIKRCLFLAGNDTTLLFSIFDNTHGKYITENYELNLSYNEKINPCKDCYALFKNLSQYILINNDVSIVCRIYRIGTIPQPHINPTNIIVSHWLKIIKLYIPMELIQMIYQYNMQYIKTKRKMTDSVIRPYGVSIIRLKLYIGRLLNNIGHEFQFDECKAPIWMCSEEKEFASLPFDLINYKPKLDKFAKVPYSIGIAHSLTLYRNDTSILRKYGEINEKLIEIEALNIDPVYYDNKHVLYVTINEVHVNQRNKRAPCNICVKMQLRDNVTYKTIPDSIICGKGQHIIPINESTSEVYYHDNDPKMCQRYHVLIPKNINQLSNCHLYFSIWHIPIYHKKPHKWNFAFIKLFSHKSKSLIHNDTYELPLHRYDKKSESKYLDSKTLKLDSKTIQIALHLSSTKIYPSMDIHKFMTWKTQTVDDLTNIIYRLDMQAYSILLTVFDELMKCLFDVLLEVKNDDLLLLTYSTLVVIFGYSNRGFNASFYRQYKPRIDLWIQNEFNCPKIWRVLIGQQLRLLTIECITAKTSVVKSINRQCFRFMNGISYIVKIMRRSYQIEIAQMSVVNAENTTIEFKHYIMQLFHALINVVKLNRKPQLQRCFIPIQNQIIIMFYDLICDASILSSQDVAFIVAEFSNNCNHGYISRCNMDLFLGLHRFLDDKKFELHHILDILLPSIFQSIDYYLTKSIHEQVTCVMVLKRTMTALDSMTLFTKMSPKLMDQFTMIMLRIFGALSAIRKMDLSDLGYKTEIFGESIRNQIQPIRKFVIPTKQLQIQQDMFVTIATSLQVVKTKINGKEYFHIMKAIETLMIENEDDAIIIIQSILEYCNEILEKSLFAPENHVMRIVEINVAITAFSCFCDILKRISVSQRSLWQQWFNLCMNILAQELETEILNEIPMFIIHENYKNISKIIMQNLSEIWSKLLPEIFASEFNICSKAVTAFIYSSHNIRLFIADIYFQTMKYEFDSTNSIHTFTSDANESIEALIIANKINDNNKHLYSEFFRISFKEKLQNTNITLKELGNIFLSNIEKRTYHLLGINMIPNESKYEDIKVVRILQLLNFCDSIKDNRLYNIYIHRMGLMHQSLSNHIEAGLCFKAHADRLLWRDNMLNEESLICLQSCAEWKRHIYLLEMSMKAFVMGKAWEMAINICHELRNVYENKLFQLKSLAAVLKREADFWKIILLDKDRVFCSYYLVTFRGVFVNKYNDDVRNKSFIYRTNETWIKFIKTMQCKYESVQRIHFSLKDSIELYDEDELTDKSVIQIISLEFNASAEIIKPLVYGYMKEQELMLDLSYKISEEIKYMIYMLCINFHYKWNNQAIPLRMRKYYFAKQPSIYFYGHDMLTKTFVIAKAMLPSIQRRVEVRNQEHSLFHFYSCT